MKHFLVSNKPSWVNAIPSSFMNLQPAVFETLRTYHGKLYWLDQHLERIQESAEIMEIEYPLNLPKLKHQIKKTRDKNYVDQDLRIKVQLNASGYCIAIFPLQPWADHYYQQGIAIADTVFERPNPEAKYVTPAYEEFLTQADSLGVQEIIFFDQAGNLREGNRTNIFALYGDQIRTPKDKILKGVMRHQVLIWAKALDLEVQETDISMDALAQADEILLTNALKGIVPVSRWNSWERKSDQVYQGLQEIFDNKIK